LLLCQELACVLFSALLEIADFPFEIYTEALLFLGVLLLKVEV
jgi:hypothetical protein